MSDKEKTAEELAAEAAAAEADKFTGVQMSKEEFSALQAKADLADKHETEITRLEEEKQAQETEQKAVELRDVAKSYNVLPVEIDEFVVNMSALESADEKAMDWVMTQFKAFDTALEKAGVLEEQGTDEEGEEDAGLAFLKIVDKTLKEDYEGDPSRYAEALLKASAEHPELAQFA